MRVTEQHGHPLQQTRCFLQSLAWNRASKLGVQLLFAVLAAAGHCPCGWVRSASSRRVQARGRSSRAALPQRRGRRGPSPRRAQLRCGPARPGPASWLRALPKARAAPCPCQVRNTRRQRRAAPGPLPLQCGGRSAGRCPCPHAPSGAPSTHRHCSGLLHPPRALPSAGNGTWPCGEAALAASSHTTGAGDP